MSLSEQVAQLELENVALRSLLKDEMKWTQVLSSRLLERTQEAEQYRRRAVALARAARRQRHWKEALRLTNVFLPVPAPPEG
jgi:hypothetical protein